MIKTILGFHFFAYFVGRLTFTRFYDNSEIFRIERTTFLRRHERLKAISAHRHISIYRIAIGILTANQKYTHGFFGNYLLGDG